MKKIWLDIINPSNVPYFRSLCRDLSDCEVSVTIRDRAETISLATSTWANGKIVGTDYAGSFKKSANMIIRTLDLAFKASKFDIAMSFENGMSVSVSKIRGKKSILYCDNDLKFNQKKNAVQDLETKIKSLATKIIIPNVCYENFRKVISEDKLIAFNGYKEDIYIADYAPDPEFLDRMPFDEFVVVRPEALGSFYVKEIKSITPKLIKLLSDNNINIIFLPREKEDIRYAEGTDVFVPKRPLNGLDLCYYARAVMTGSGTFAREAACMGTTSVSFFPSDRLLSVDKKLVEEGKIFHSKNPKEISDHIISNYTKKKELKLERSKKVKKDVVNITNEIINKIM